ncbi:MAG: nucleoside 2-deoxyribosyltransferase [Candidatus Poribacteria bacterium]|nr:nucleoside 2-deoxyribosyltransferase [Candidatus Poribacteria bacterium]
MKAYISIKFREDNSNKYCIQKISSALERNGFETVCIARDIENWGQVELSPEELMQRSFAAIESSDVFVVDLSEKGVGLGIEAGYAHAVKIPVVVIAKAGSDISTTLQGISQKLLFYETFDDLVQFFEVSMVPDVRQ